MKIKKIIKKIISIEFYEDILISILRFFVVKPYYFFKNQKYKLLFKKETYENGLIKFLRFLINRSPIYLWFFIKEKQSVISNKLSGKKEKLEANSYHLTADERFKSFYQKHPFQSAGASLATFLLIIGGAGYLLFSYYSSQASAWWNDDWLYRKQLTINSSQVTADLTNFPILVSITDGDLSSKAQSDGDDIVFTLDQGNQLHHEIESFDSTTGELTAWVKIPELDSDEDSYIYIYYGNPTTDNMQKAIEVWDENFVMVQHMDDVDSSNVNDSTRNNIFGVKGAANNPDEIEGKINKSQDFDEISEYIIYDDGDFFNWTPVDDEITISAWFYPTVIPGDDENFLFLASQQGNLNYVFALNTNSSSQTNLICFILNSDWSSLEGYFGVNWTPTINEWYHIVFATSTAGNNEIYIDGVAQVVSEFGWDDNSEINANLIYTQATDTSRGLIDELHYSNTARSDDWIETEFNNQDDPAAFLSVGYEERGNSPVLYLPLDEGFGTTAHDESSAHNDATISGATWADEDMCKTGRCLQFDGDDYLEIDDDNTLDLTNEMTMEAWVKPTSTNKTNQTIISKQEKPDEPTKIYRSVGPSATTAITTGSSNEMTITGTTATFQSSLPTNVGVGDAIQYDDDSDGDIDSDDSIVFISGRITERILTPISVRRNPDRGELRY